MSTVEQQPTPTTAEDVHYCEVHPERETSLRCNKCGRYMCVQCAVLTPVGYRCRQCVRQHEDKFYAGTNNDYIIAFAACIVLGGVAGFVSRYVPFFLFAFIIGIPVGGFVSEIVLRLTKRRRGRYSGEIAAAGVVLGGVIGALAQVYSTYSSAVNEYARYAGDLPENVPLPSLSLDALLPIVFSDVSLLIFVGVIAFIVYGRLKMRF
jgi:hypothetical protein